MLLIEQKKYFLKALIELHHKLDGVKTHNTLQALERFESQLTLRELDECFLDTRSEHCERKLKELLAKRWERIRNSSMCYTQKPSNSVNQLCLNLATALSPRTTTASEIEALEPNTGPYCLLMSSLENSEDVYGGNIHHLKLHEFILSDKERVFIPLASCLHQASLSDEGHLRHMVLIDASYPALIPSEIERVSKHSKQAAEFYQSILAFNKQRLLGNTIEAKLTSLVAALRSGGAHWGRGSGTELNAGAAANLGILAFNKYWETLSEQQKAAIFAETPQLRDIIGRLFRPEDANYTEVRFCVELLANALDPIIEIYNKKPSIQILQKKVDAQEKALHAALKKSQELVLVQNSNPPKHILHLIYTLSRVKQNRFFNADGYDNALVYALAREPEALPEFKLDEKSRQQAILTRIHPNNDTGLIIAAKLGKKDTIRLLLRWGAAIDSHDINGSTALHWAANNGHIDAVNCLLEHGALLEARGDGYNTTLLFAVLYGQGTVVQRLLEENADINARNEQGRNALDIALARHPEHVEPILMHMASLPADKQTECLLNVSHDVYPNVLFYAAAHKPALFDTLIMAALEQPKCSSIALFTAKNQKGYTPLILATQLGAKESVRTLLELGLDTESHDNNGSTALHWAAYHGHIDAVNCLLEHGALLEARGDGYYTPLHFAVMCGRRAVVQRLLGENADMTTRNDEGLNALDIALKRHPELVAPILMHLASLPADKQTECLLNVSHDFYPNVLFYAAAHKPSLFDSLITAALEQPDIRFHDALFTTENQKGYTPLILAAQLGAKESVRTLLDLGLNTESHDTNGSTALHWAANNGHIDAVHCLLEHGALLEARGDGHSTPLHFAVMYGRGAVVQRLLEENADLSARDNRGFNALDNALAYHPELVEPILMQLATLPVDKQAQCLLNVPGSPYSNVLFYAITENINLLSHLLRSFNNNQFDSMQPIHKHLHEIGLHYQKMKKKSSHNLNYKTAVSTTESLLKACTEEMFKVYQSNDSINTKLKQFKISCKEAIETARPVLTKYRELGKVLAEFLLAILTLPISLPLYAAGFFSVKTKSEQLIDKLQAGINKLA